VHTALAEPWVDSDGSEYGYMWYTADGTEIGPEIWGAFAIIQGVFNDTGSGTMDCSTGARWVLDSASSPRNRS